MFSPAGMDLERGWPGRIDGDRVVQLAAQTLQAFFAGGGGAREHAEYPLAEVELRPPVLHPQTVRIFDGDEFVFSNTAGIVGTGATIGRPEGSTDRRYRSSVAAVIGADGAIGGYTLANAWVALDLPGAKRHDFALSLGPTLSTDAARFVVSASVGGVPDTTHTFEPDWGARLAHAARNTVLRPGDVLVTLGSVGTQALSTGATVQLENAEIGVLANTVA
ncbi:MAG: fumarylacetoacetate hydrolase family protein [Actinomycetes bacterium]